MNTPLLSLRQACLHAIWLAALSGLAWGLNIPATPLSATRVVEPNITYLLDDSGSMMWDVMPDENVLSGFHGFLYPMPGGTYGSGLYYSQSSLNGPWTSYSDYYRMYLVIPTFADNNIYSVYLRSSKNNTLYYNPEKTYLPWKDGEGKVYGVDAGFTDANPKKAYFNPADKSEGSVDLTVQQGSNNFGQYGVHWYSANTSDYRLAAGVRNISTQYDAKFYPMTFYVFESGDSNLISSYTRYQVRNGVMYKKRLPSGAETVANSFEWGGRRTLQQEMVNFANWFQFYRSRALAAKASSSLAFADLGADFRVGFATINKRGSTSYEMTVPTSGNFSSTNRINFFNKLLSVPIDPQGTPLRGALAWAGNTYRDSYWRDNVSCRRAFTILTTDGYWNGDDSLSFGNQDGSEALPYKDSFSNTLADVAMYYWKTDLSTLKNDLQPSRNNPQNQQHMTTFGLSLGPKGLLDPTTDLPALTSGALSWPNPGASGATSSKIDDLWHAALNSRGNFVAASDPDEFRKGLVRALSEITQMAGSQSAGASTSAVYTGGSQYYQSGFDSGNWTGTLRAYDLQLNNSSVIVNTSAKWNAADKLVSDAGRKILLGRGGSNGGAMPFQWNTIQTEGLATSSGLSAALVDYLRGNGSNEGTQIGRYRPRNTRLGDIVGSSPEYVGEPSEQLSEFKQRTPMVYVNANDGMLHAFSAKTGSEMFAYIPSQVLPRLKKLAAQNYADNHEYFVDGLITIEEARRQSDDKWRTFLASSLGRGGKSLFLLDVTNPDGVTEQSSTLAQWEFGSEHDSHVGMLHQIAPSIVKLNDNRYYVLAPNGYNSSTGSAALFILPVKTTTGSWVEGSNYRRLTADTSGNNGLSAITPHDLDGNGTIDIVYAGDLKGNVWKFDLSSADMDNWKVALDGKALFKAIGPGGLPQPIAAAPVVAPHPDYVEQNPTVDKTGLMVFVGTGRYLDSCDKAGGNCIGEDSKDSIYGLWDYGGVICQRKELQAQYLQNITVPNATAGSYRKATDNGLVYPASNIVSTDCMQGSQPRSGTITRKADGTIDKSFPFPAFSLSQAERDKIASYWLGWYIDLPLTDERVVSYLDYYRKRLEVQTFIPAAVSSDVCSLGKDEGYILRINYRTGGPFVSPRFDDPLISKAIAAGVSGSSAIVGKRTAGSLGRIKIRNGSRLSTILSLTSGGTAGELDELIGRKVSRVSWREVITD